MAGFTEVQMNLWILAGTWTTNKHKDEVLHVNCLSIFIEGEKVECYAGLSEADIN